nr:unnamed protein product [Digitaria exilis]
MVSFKARRREPELVAPARPTPRETKALSDIDDQHALRYYETVIGFFRRCSGDDGPEDPAEAARSALAEALVYYYPVAGRLREEAGGKLVVDCTAEGVAFVEADADVRLEDFGEPLLPPYPCVEELLCDPALGYKSGQLVRLMITMNARGRWNRHTLIPWGYYGNAHFSPIAELTVDELCKQPLIDTVELVHRTKVSVTKECMESMVQTIASLRHKPCADPARTYEVSDTKWIAAGNGLQLGWAEYVGGGIPVAGDITSKLGSDHMRCKNQDGEDSTVVSMLLPRPAMDRKKQDTNSINLGLAVSSHIIAPAASRITSCNTSTDKNGVLQGSPDEPQLVSPAWPTPRETKPLSDIDDQHLLRYYETVVGFFRTCPGRTDRPADLMRATKAALAEALVYYYPVAGRLREEAGAKLVVDCTAEGVVFVEAEADVALEEFGEPLLPPYPCLEELLCDPGEINAVIGRPLLFMQVTELKCGGFVAGFHMCHNIADGFDMIQFMIAVAELAVGDLAGSATSFELITAVMWRCRTIALGYQSKLTVGELCRQPFADTVELVRKTKLSVTKERMRSIVDTTAYIRQWPSLVTMDKTYEVSDTRWIAAGNGFQLGWAEYVGGGIPLAGDLTSKLGSHHMMCKNEDGEVSTVVSLLMPRLAMERFKKEMDVWLNKTEKNLIITSSL